MEGLAQQFGLEIAQGGIDPRVLLGAITAMSARMDGGVRDIARAIERQVTDGLIEARAAEAKCVRLAAEGQRVRVFPVTPSGETPHRAAEMAANPP